MHGAGSVKIYQTKIMPRSLNNKFIDYTLGLQAKLFPPILFD